MITGATMSQAYLWVEDDGACLAIENPSQLGRQYPDFANMDLIRIGEFAATTGFKVSGFMLADVYGDSLTSPDSHEVSAVMLMVLDETGASGLISQLSGEFDGLKIDGVELISPATGRRISIRRRGFVFTSAIEEAEALLNAAWTELKLGDVVARKRNS